MATLSFLHIGKANARIKELETQVSTLTKERDDALTAIEANAGEVSKSAEQLQIDLATASVAIDTLKTDLAASLMKSAALATEVAALTAKLASKDEETKVTISQRVATAQAALGQPPAPAIPANAQNTKTATSGMARVLEVCREDLAKVGYTRKN